MLNFFFRQSTREVDKTDPFRIVPFTEEHSIRSSEGEKGALYAFIGLSQCLWKTRDNWSSSRHEKFTMEVQRETDGGGPCPFPCSLSSLLSMNCRARAEGLARRLQTQIRQKHSSSAVEGTLLVESNGKVRLASSEGRAYSLDDHHIDAFKTTSAELKSLRPIHVVTSEPTLHLCLPPQPDELGEGVVASPTEQEQDSDVYYDFDLVTPPDDYACQNESRVTSGEAIPEENEKPEKPESGCVTSVTSPIMFANGNFGNFALPPNNPPSPYEECPPEEVNSRASDVDLEAIRQLLVSSKLQSLYTLSDAERPIEVADNQHPDFVGVVRERPKSLTRTPSDKSYSSSDRSSSDEGELVIPVHEEEKTLVLSEEEITRNSSYYLPPPSSYQIFSNQENGFDSGEISATSLKKQNKSSKRRPKKKKTYSHNSSVSESSDSRESSLETQEREFPITTTSSSEKPFVLKDPPHVQKCLYKQDFHRSHSEECSQEEKLSRAFKTSNSIDKCSYVLLPERQNDDTQNNSYENLPKGKQQSLNSKVRSKKYLVYSSSIESVSSPEEGANFFKASDRCTTDIQPSDLADYESKAEKKEESETQRENVMSKKEIEINFLNEEKFLQEIDDAISILKRESGDDAVEIKLTKYEKTETETIGFERNEREKQVAGSYFESAFGAQDGCQQFVPGSQRCELCDDDVPFLSFKHDFRDETNDLTTFGPKYPSFCDIKNTPNELGNIYTEIEMPKSKGRIKVKRASAELQSSSSLGTRELPPTEKTNLNVHETSPDSLSLNLNEKLATSSSSERKCETSLQNNSTSSPIEEKEKHICHLNKKSIVNYDSQLLRQSPLQETANIKDKLLCFKENNVNKIDLTSDKEPYVNHSNFKVIDSKDSKQSSIEESDNQSEDFVRPPSNANTPSLLENENDRNESATAEAQIVISCIDSTQPALSPDETFQTQTPRWPWSRRKRLRNKIPLHSEEKTERFLVDGTCEEHSVNTNEKRVDGLENTTNTTTTTTVNDNNSIDVSPAAESFNSISNNLSSEQLVPNLASKEGDCVDNNLTSLPKKQSYVVSRSEEETSIIFDKSLLQQNDKEKDSSSLSYEIERDIEIKNTASPTKCQQENLLPANGVFCSEESEMDDQTNKNTSNDDEITAESSLLEPNADRTSEEEVIDTLPEEDNDENEKQNEDSDDDDEAIITGRFKNLTKYKEKVRRSSSEDDGLPPPPTEVILIDYNEPQEMNPEEDIPENETDIRSDLEMELNKLNIEEITVQGPSDESERSSEERETDVDRQQRIKRSSSLRCGKTPPGTPGRKKIVRFADCLGLDLADIRTFLDGIPNVPASAFCDLQVEEDAASSSDATAHHSLPSYGSYSAAASAAAALLQNQARRILTPMFQQPGSLPDFYNRLREQKVVLENVSVGADLSVKGIVRVINESYHKKVYIRYTFDQWKNYHEVSFF